MVQTTGAGPLGTPPDGQRSAEVPVVSDGPQQRRRRRRRLILLAAGALLLVGTSLGLGLGLTAGGPAGSGTQLRSVTRVVPVRRGTMQQAISANGVIQPAQVADLNFTVSGRVTAVDAAVGQTVGAGAVLAAVSATALDVQEASAQASYDAAEAKLAADRNAGAPTSQVQADVAAIAAAAAQLTTAKKAVAGATLLSPIAGTVASVGLTVGEQVSGSSGSASSPSRGPSGGTLNGSGAQVVVESTDNFVIDTTVDDTQVGALAVGDHVLVVPTASAPPVPGTLTSVGQIAQPGTGIPSYPITITLTGTPSGIVAGMTAQLTIVVKQLKGVLEVPTPAISYKRGRPAVTVVEAGGARVVHPVTIGTTTGGETEITHGLSAGARVAVRVETVVGGSRGGRRSNPVVITPGALKARAFVTGSSGSGFVGYAPLQANGG